MTSLHVVAIGAVALASVMATATRAGDLTPKVLLVGIDGLRADAMLAAEAPNLDALIADGCWTDRAWASPFTVSGPGWSDWLCAVWPEKHGAIDNDFKDTHYDRYPHFFARLKEKRPDLVTAHFADWLPIDQLILGGHEPDIRFAVDYTDNGDAKTVEAVRGILATRDPDIVFVYFADVDVAGHNHGFHPASPEYLAEIAEVDGQIGRILEALRARTTHASEDWLILVSTDHGGTIDGIHGRDEEAHRRIPFIVSGRAAARGILHASVNQVDVPAIALAHLGVEIDPAWGWDGRVVGLKSPGTPLDTNLIFNGDAEYSTGWPDAKNNPGIAGWTDLGPMTVNRYGSPNGYPTVESPGPPGAGTGARGDNFFAGGAGVRAEITQRLDVADRASDIDAGRLAIELRAWLGGYAEQRDLAWVEARMLDARDATLGAVRIGPVTLADRRLAFGGEGDRLTGLLERSADAPVAPGTRRIEVLVIAEGAAGDNDGYVDNLSLVLRKAGR